MTAVAQPALIKRINPDAASTPRTGLNLWARIALWTILVFAGSSLTRVIIDSSATPQIHNRNLAESRERLVASANARRARSTVGSHASNQKAKSRAPRMASEESHRVEAGTPHRISSSPWQTVGRLDYQDAAAWLSLRLGYYSAAVSYLSEAIQKNSRDGYAYDQRAEAYRRTGKPALAASDYEHAMTINPKDASAMKGLAWLLTSSPKGTGGDHKQAITLAQQACSLTGWKDADAIEALAAAYASAGAFDKAIQTQGQALALQHDSSRAASRLVLYAQHKAAQASPIL